MATATKTVDDVARELGFAPAAKFVTLTPGGVVGFTCGKPEEVETLAFRAVKAGYNITPSLQSAAGFSSERIVSIRAIQEMTREQLASLDS